jgi:hypothetical protein
MRTPDSAGVAVAMIRSATNRSCRIHIAEAMFSYGEGLQQGESHGEEKEQEEQVEDLKRASL